MNTEHQKQFLEMLAKVWAKYPEWRFGQLVDNLNGCLKAPQLFYTEDMDLFARMEFFLSTNNDKPTEGKQ